MSTSRKVALGGMITALSLVLLFLTGLFPFATLALPALAGVLLVVIVIELGRRQALLIYVAVSLLGLAVAPDREAAVFYILIFGYYPILKSLLEQLRLRVVEYLLKGLLFSTVIVGSYLVIVVLMGLEEVEPSAPWLIGGFLGLLFTCFLYDFALSRIIGLYLYRLRKSLSKWTKFQN